MTNDSLNELSEEEKRHVWKMENHLITLVHGMHDLQGMPISWEFFKKVDGLRKHASLASRRFGKISSNHLSVVDRMKFHQEAGYDKGF